MAIVHFRGDAQKIPQVDHFTPVSPEIGDVFTLTINGKDISVTSQDGTVADIVNQFVAAIGDYFNEIPEFAEVSASAGTTDGVVTHLILTGPADGRPFTATASTADAGNLKVTITVVQEGSPAKNEKQQVSFRGTPTGGTFTLTFDGQTTAAIAYNAAAAAVQTALEALSNIAPGDVSVTGNGPWTVEFTGNYAATNVPAMTGNGSGLTGACRVEVDTTGEGGPGTNELQRITASNSFATTGGTWRINWVRPNGTMLVTDWMISGVSAAYVQGRLEAAGAGDSGGFSVTSTGSGGTTYYYIEFINQYGNQNVNQMTVQTSVGTASDYFTVSTDREGSGSGTGETQVVTLIGGPTGGTFTLTFSGQTTAAIAHNADAATVEAALEALSNITDVSVTGAAGGPWTVVFIDPGGDVVEMIGDGSALTGSAVDINTTQSASSGVNEQQSVTVDPLAQGGTFTLTWNPGGGDETTAAIAYNASAATVQAALEALPTPAAGDFAVSGNDGGPYTVEFKGGYANTDVTTMSGDGGNLTGSGTQSFTKTSVTSPSGPTWWSVAENWDTGALPASGDTAVFGTLETDCLDGLDQSAVALAELVFQGGYVGRVGNHRWNQNGYYEYRKTELAVGAATIHVGLGDGRGTPRGRLDTGASQTTLHVYRTDSGETDDPAFIWRGTHVANAVNVYGGDVGIGMEQYGQAATVGTLRVGTLGDTAGGARVIAGTNVALSSVNVYSGELISHSGCTTLRIDGGTATFRNGAVITTATVNGGTLYHESNGNIGTLTVGPGGSVDFSRDSRPKTVTNCTLKAGSTLRDPGGTVTFTNGIVLDNCTLADVTLEIGPNVTITIS